MDSGPQLAGAWMFVRPGDGLGRIPGGLPSSGLPAPQLSDLVPLGLSSWDG